VGMMKSLRPDLTAQQVYQILQSTGAETRNTVETGKLIQPAEAMKKVGSR